VVVVSSVISAGRERRFLYAVVDAKQAAKRRSDLGENRERAAGFGLRFQRNGAATKTSQYKKAENCTALSPLHKEN
jgi:hypothetical protein